MKSIILKWNPKSFLLVIVFLLFALDIAVLFNIPVARQVIGFICLTFVPGLIIFKLLKLDKFGIVESVLFIVGFSISFLILAGLFTNEFAFQFGVSRPLSSLPLLAVFNGFVLAGGVSVYFKNRSADFWPTRTIEIAPSVILFLCLPLLSIFGAVYMTTYGSNLFLLLLIVLITVLFVVGTFSKKVLPPNLYPFALLMIAIALLFHASLFSRYIFPFGSDVPGEYIVFESAESLGRWVSNPLTGNWYGRMNSMVSITILPAFYSSILNIYYDWVKIIFPLIFSLVPVGLYQIWQTYVGKKYAFFSVFLFISFETFFTEMLGLNRKIIAELFLVLLLIIIVNKSMKPSSKMACFILFSFGLIASHYALAEIFVFFLAFALISLIILKRPSKNITVTMIVLFLAVMFAWYIYTSHATTFGSIVEDVGRVYQKLGDFFVPEARGQAVLEGLGLAESPSVLNTISRMFAYLTQGLIVLGAVGLFRNRSNTRFGREWFLFSITAMVLLASLIIVPGLANTLNMTRFYHILLFFLAPLSVVGADYAVTLLSKRKKELLVTTLLLCVLVPYFLFQTEFVFEVAGGHSWSVSLSSYRMNIATLYGKDGYADSQSVYGALWLSKNVDVQNADLYADTSSLSNTLRIYGMVYAGNYLSKTTTVGDNGVVYLSTLNVNYGTIIYERSSFNSSDIHFVFDGLNNVYSDGGSVILKQMP
jgi:uncharacterized membrane protein